MEELLFCDYYNKLRTDSGKSLRQFCRENSFDWGNISRIERGVAPPPSTQDVLEKHALALGLKHGSDEWNEFHDLAAAQNGRIPFDLQKDETLIPKLPALFRSIREKSVSKEKLLELAEEMRNK